MSKAGNFAKILKLTVSLLASAVKVAVIIMRRLLHELFKGLGKRLRFSITFKMAATYTMIFSVILLIVSIILVSSFGFFLLYESKNSLEKNTKVVINIINESSGVPQDSLKTFARIQGISVDVFNKQKEITFTTEADPQNVTFNDSTGAFAGINISGDGRLFVNTRTAQSDEICYIQLTSSLLEEKLYLAVMLVAVIISFILAVFLTVFIGSRSLRKMLQPIDDMIRTAKSISGGDLHTRLNVVDSHDELKDLAETFNEMLDRIGTSYEQQNQFVSDASHELRTPIAVIQGYANLLQRWGKEDREVLGESVTAIKNEADNMKSLVENLLFLARADKNTQKLAQSAFQVNELIDEVLKETRLIDTTHNIACEINESVTMNADRGLIKQALRVFIDNSMKYTPPGGTITLNSRMETNRVKFLISDNGIGIAKEDLPYIFNRFYKCDKSRTREGGSTGLGLSIAKWIIEIHRGTIQIQSVPTQGTKITVDLPVI